MENISQIVTLFGGVSKLASASDNFTPQMVANWRTRGSIPAKHIPVILSAASDRKIDLTYADFFEGGGQ